MSPKLTFIYYKGTPLWILPVSEPQDAIDGAFESSHALFEFVHWFSHPRGQATGRWSLTVLFGHAATNHWRGAFACAQCICCGTLTWVRCITSVGCEKSPKVCFALFQPSTGLAIHAHFPLRNLAGDDGKVYRQMHEIGYVYSKQRRTDSAQSADNYREDRKGCYKKEPSTFLRRCLNQ